MTVFDDVAVKIAPVPLSTTDGAVGRVGVMLASVNVALKLPIATGLNWAARKQVTPGGRLLPAEQPREPCGVTVNTEVSPVML